MDERTEATTVIIVFAKAPIPGHSKTRLIPLLGAQGAAQLQARLIDKTLHTANDARVGPVELWCAPNSDHAFLRECGEGFSVALQNQCNGDIGQRMQHAIEQVLQRSARTILIGTDCPVLTIEDLHHGANALTEGHHAAFLPVEDGGYTLIALRECASELFTDINWSTEHVMTQTRERLRTLGWSWSELPMKWDLDRPADYARLQREWPALANPV